MIVIKNDISVPIEILEKEFINQTKGNKKILLTDLTDKISVFYGAFYQLSAKLAIINPINASNKLVIFKRNFKNGC